MIPRRLTLAGLLVLLVWLLASPPAGPDTEPGTRLLIGLLCATPLLILLVASQRAVRQWGIWVAIVMIPYFTLSVGALLVSPGQRLPGATLATIIALVFFSGIAASRQPP
ncbi:MAG: DUF2069 domain-containing protein [Gammaproteobacteria bacterium]|nr:DUF2069 domain-containing protein [Gammaproteobacteria bacterium]